MSAALTEFAGLWRAHDEREERRLAYVAVTRPRRLLLCSGFWWGEGVKRPRGPSVFLREIEALCETGAGVVDVWTVEPAGEANPMSEVVPRAEWPNDPLGWRPPVDGRGGREIRAAEARGTGGADKRGSTADGGELLDQDGAAEAIRWRWRPDCSGRTRTPVRATGPLESC